MQYWVCTVITNGVGAVLKVCTVIEETLSEFKIYCANRLVSIFIALFSMNVVQYLFISSFVVMAGTSIIREFLSVREVLMQL
jgi:hypothetical protein